MTRAFASARAGLVDGIALWAAQSERERDLKLLVGDQHLFDELERFAGEDTRH